MSLKRPADARPSCWSDGPTWANPPCSTELRAPGGRSSRPSPGRPATRMSQPAEWLGTPFTLVDTGGLFGASEDPLHELVVIQGQKALEAADVIVFVVDGREGLVPADEEIAGSLRSANVPVLVAVNKTDDKRARDARSSSIGWASSRSSRLPPSTARAPATARRGRASCCRPGSEGVREAEPEEVAVAIVGRPNVGKSSLLNRLLHEERAIVSDMPGTTRDSVDALLRWQRRIFRIVDTAGIRQRGRRSRGRASSKPSASSSPGGRSRRRTCGAGDRLVGRRRPIRMRRLPAKPRRPGAGSSSPPTSGI